jgi:aspartate aminotransferase
MSTSGFSFDFSDRIQKVAPSKTTQIFALAESRRRQGHAIINLAVGEPDFETPSPIIEATRKALAEGITRYGPVAGIPQLRQRLAECFDGYDEGNILITNGAKQALFALFQVLLQAGDEIIIPAPCWVSFTEQVKLSGATPVLVETENGRLDLEGLENALTTNTRAILINTPNNPTGAVYDPTELAQVADLASRYGLFLIADEAYHAFTYDGRSHTRLFDLCEDKTRVITVRSFSKHYNMTGYRLGYVVAHADVISALIRLQGHLSGNVCSFAQHGALAALEMSQDIVDQRRATLEQRRNLALELASSLFPCQPPHGAFYLFVDVSKVLAPNQNDTDLCLDLLKNAGVAVVPGSSFFGPGHLRISFGASEAELRNGFKKIKEVL